MSPSIAAHFRIGLYALHYRENWAIMADSSVIQALTEWFDEVCGDPADPGPMVEDRAVSLLIQCMTFSPLVNESPLMRFKYAVWVVSSWLSSTGNPLGNANTNWRSAFGALVDASRHPADTARLTDQLVDTVRDWIHERVVDGRRLEPLSAFLAAPMTADSPVWRASEAMCAAIRRVLEPRNLVTVEPMIYHNPEYGPDFSDRPENRQYDRDRVPDRDLVLIVHTAAATGLGSISEMAIEARVNRVILQGTERMSPLISGGDPVILPLEGAWDERLLGWLDANENALRTRRTLRAGLLETADRKREEIRTRLEAGSPDALIGDWKLFVPAEDLIGALRSTQRFMRLTHAEVAEVDTWLDQSGAPAVAAADSKRTLKEVAKFLPALTAIEAQTGEAVARDRRWSTEIKQSVFVLARASKVSAGANAALQDLSQAASWLQIANNAFG